MDKIKTISCSATSNTTITIPDNSKITILYFYPKDMTPGCTTESIDFSEYNEQFNQAGAVIYGVSRDDMKSHEKFKAKHNMPFELISDTDQTLCDVFNVVQPKKFMGREYIGIVRSTFVIDTQGNILKSWSNVKVKNHAKEVLEFIQSL